MKDTEFFLSTLPREDYQQVYEASLKDEVTCKACGKPVKLYIGLSKPPYFYHTLIDDHLSCKNLVDDPPIQAISSQQSDSDNEYIEQNGFRIPKSRSIATMEKPQVTEWRQPKALKGRTPFAIKRKTSSSFLGITLDDEQKEAVMTIDGPLLILAGAGSGKTRVLTTRALYMIEEKSIDPGSMMLVTFTAKAAREMHERLKTQTKLPASHLNRLVIGTFHSIFYKMLLHDNREKWNGQHLLKWDWQKESYLKQACRELDIDEKDFPFDQAIQQIGYWKNTLKTPTNIHPSDEWEETALSLYTYYEEQKHQRGQFDFDDMLVKCYDMLKENTHLLSAYQNRFHYFLIDEFQDINPVQYKLMKLLSNHTNNICGVGDDDQTIYSFRGSEPSFILKFKEEYPEANIITLSSNYRSDHHIVSSANEVISKNKHRLSKKMYAQFQTGHSPICFFPYDEEEEATMIVNDIKEKIEDGAMPHEFAILYRTHTGGRAVFERFVQSSIPFVIEKEQSSFYERKMVRGVLAYLRLSVDTDDTSALTELIRALFLKQSVLNDVKALSILHDCSLVDALLYLKELPTFQMAKLKKIIPRMSSLKKEKPVKALQIIEKELGFNDYLKKQGNEGNAMDKGSDDLNDLKVVAKKFSTVPEFLQHTDHMTLTQKALKGQNNTNGAGVQLMTIHRSKGLEFKYVYIACAVDGSLPHDFALESARKGDYEYLEEERRLLYVAMTRAKEHLLISCPSYRRGRKASPSRFLKDLLN
ncbi:ATP-dependent DNA helicase Rep [Metabacillus sediminilitoris]|uniref:DNA 3'-5' helicase n=2 Tax=Metabacillus sediminilitoris TaxID=2567941 RepID=A0A4S4C0M5_9BACI|nr:ATP-dependent helicase [Metabacillus sediminilitoris]QGQ48610.1 AAA family ATPase [Metabacillus sediminilitoris]THF79032.1 ATP-dependent DNA helicase Rep [Metabacillus sediminilitoris]